MPNPATQLADDIAAKPTYTADPSSPSPAVQLANSIADQPAENNSRGSVPRNDDTSYNRPQQSQYSESGSTAASSTGARDGTSGSNPADFINQGIQAAASTAEDVVTQTAAAAIGGISGAADLTTQGITAAERAAEDTSRNLANAAETALSAAATAVGGAAGAVDGAVSSGTNNTTSSNSRTTDRARGNGVGSGQSAAATGSFDSVNVRVPANMAWANATPARGTMR